MLPADLPLINSRILLAVTGSVAACKADRIISELTDRGADVQVLLTESGARFFPPETAGSLTEFPVVGDQFADTPPGDMQHIDLKNQTDAILVAPATANRLLSLDRPHASDTLGTVLTAFSGPVLYAPAMNPDMWNQKTVQSVIQDHSARVIQPESGTMACGETGPGRLADPDQIAEVLTQHLWPQPLQGTDCVVSAGPTREEVDDVRYLTNRSSGKMGEALAKIACRLGASVTLVTGADRTHYGFSTYDRRRVTSTESMYETLRGIVENTDLYIGAAAVSDYRPRRKDGKISSGQEDLSLSMEPTTDIISSLRELFPDTTMVGFSADDAEDASKALEKAEKKDLDAVVFNSIKQSDGAFGSNSNRASLCFPPDQVIFLGKRSKLALAQQILLGTLNHDLL